MTNWFLDFDDTLAKGGLTWALEVSLPNFIREHQLVYDEAHLKQTMLDLQQQASQNPNPMPLLHQLFVQVGWNTDLEMNLLNDINANYRPTLFEDTLPFLERLKANGQAIYVLSNNPTAPRLLEAVNLTSYITKVFTPKSFEGALRKPHRSMWDFILGAHDDITVENSVMVGNDPWTEGAFAQSCGLPIWLVDRTQRFTHLYDQSPFRWVGSLMDIVFT